MIEFQCTSCSQSIHAEDQYAGKLCNCPGCNADNTIPGISTVSPGPAENAPLSNKLQLNTQYAGFWKRFLAILIDGIILAFAGGILSAIFGGIMRAILGASGFDMQMIQIVTFCLSFTISSILRLLYFTIMESSRLQATVGKMALGIIVTDETGNRISFMRANGRFFAKMVSALILYIGYIMAGFTERKQALHDIIASTYVIKKTQ